MVELGKGGDRFENRQYGWEPVFFKAVLFADCATLKCMLSW